MGGVAVGALAAILLGILLALGGLTVAAICVRRRRAQRDPQKQKPATDMLELIDGDSRYVVSYTIKPSGAGKTEPQPDILNAPDGDSQIVEPEALRTEEWPSSNVTPDVDWGTRSGTAVFSAGDLALLDNAVQHRNLSPSSCAVDGGLHGFKHMNPGFNINSPTLASTVGCNGGLSSPANSTQGSLTGPTLSSGSLANSTLHRRSKNTRRREHVLAENLPGPESCV